MTVAERFKEEASALLSNRIEALSEALTYEKASSLPEAVSEDVVVAGKEILLTIFRQSETPQPGQILVTVQIARHSLGGMMSFHTERGLVLSRSDPTREATDGELAESGA